jgi:hypothetical protein
MPSIRAPSGLIEPLAQSGVETPVGGERGLIVIIIIIIIIMYLIIAEYN